MQDLWDHSVLMRRTKNYYLNLALVFLIFLHPNLFDSARKIFLSATNTKLFSYTNGNWSTKCSTLHILFLAINLNQTSYKPVPAIHNVWCKTYNGATILTFWLYNWIIKINIVRSISFSISIFGLTFLLKLFVWTKYAINKVYRKTATTLWTICIFGASYSKAIT